MYNFRLRHKVISLFILLLVAIPSAADHALPLEKEKFLGTLFMQQLYGEDFVILDPSINDYLQKLGNRLAQHADAPDYKLHYFGVASDELNAFAFFGGHVAVHIGLIQQVRNESELAAVLAHETAHIAQKHLPRIAAQNQKMLPLTIAQILAATAIGMLGGGEAGSHLATAAMANHMQQLINYTYTHEQEADRIGMQILTKANFNPHAMGTVFQYMQQKFMYQDKSCAYLHTHPLLELRIADAENRAARLPYTQTPDDLMFHLVRAKLELYRKENDSDRIKRLKTQITSGRCVNQTATQYAYALALAKNNQFPKAIQQLRELANQTPHHWMIDLSLAETEYAAGHTEIALNLLEHLTQLYPNHPPMVLSYATILLDVNPRQSGTQIEKLLSNLLIHQRDYPANPYIYELLARAQSSIPKPVACHQSQAEWHAARGELKKAIQQLDFALEKIHSNSRLATAIHNRKNDLTEMLDKQKEL